jgi:hypothetical protein
VLLQFKRKMVPQLAHEIVADHPNLVLLAFETNTNVREEVLETTVPGVAAPEKFPMTGEELSGPS